MPKARKLNAMRLLEARGIAYQVYEYDARIRDAEQVAAAAGLPASQVFKTLVVESQARKKPLLVMLPCHCALNLKRLAKALGEKKLAMAPQARAEQLTGLQAGGISPLALTHKSWQVCLDQRAMHVSHIAISAGKRGMQIRLARRDLLELLACQVVDVAQRKPD